MDPRELWERNNVLAEAFCTSDERVRQAQSVLDEAQVERSRVLAAFAVAVGNDRSVADVMGLNEREVRVARRTVGKDEARTVAQALLDASQTLRVSHEPLSDSAAEAQPPHPRNGASPLPPAAEPPEPIAPPVHHVCAADDTVIWTPSMDSVLMWSWKSDLDLQRVATELNLDLRALLLRVQALAGEGLLTLHNPSPDGSQFGRHRGRHEDPYAALSTPSTTPFTETVHY